MKNIHVLPTDKPSRLRINPKGKLILSNIPIGSKGETQNIYITSDEEIKANEWFYCPALKRQQVFGHDNIPKDRGFKKIILTTDQDLIDDGIEQLSEDKLLKIVEFLNSGKNIESFDEL